MLGLPIKDKDYVVVGSSPKEMEAMGYLPIGNNFPVFIEKSTKFEYALARKEKKNGHGYKGFKFYYSPNISLEEDLMRRDLTINAIAKNDAGQIIDPFNGVADLRKRLLRHVSDAFIEDPIRVLRVARFAARFKFTVAEETKRLMRKMSKSGELNHLVPERVWKELSTGLMEKYPSQLIEVLSETNSLSYILPKSKELNFIDLQKLKAALDYAAARRLSLECRVAIFARSLISETTKYETITKKDINLVLFNFEESFLSSKRYHGKQRKNLEFLPSY